MRRGVAVILVQSGFELLPAHVEGAYSAKFVFRGSSFAPALLAAVEGREGVAGALIIGEAAGGFTQSSFRFREFAPAEEELAEIQVGFGNGGTAAVNGPPQELLGAILLRGADRVGGEVAAQQDGRGRVVGVELEGFLQVLSALFSLPAMYEKLTQTGMGPDVSVIQRDGSTERRQRVVVLAGAHISRGKPKPGPITERVEIDGCLCVRNRGIEIPFVAGKLAQLDLGDGGGQAALLTLSKCLAGTPDVKAGEEKQGGAGKNDASDHK